MTFQFRDEHLDSYHRGGYAIFRNLIPPTLLGELRQAAGLARQIAHEQIGPQAQRLQPLWRYDLPRRPFQDYAQLPGLRDGLDRLLGPDFQHPTLEPETGILGLLLEPGDLPWCTGWHRDWRDTCPGLPTDQWLAVQGNPRFFNQVNCALYADSCTWIVPGSHLRRDLSEEARRFPLCPNSPPKLDGLSYEEREGACLAYCQSMPGALRVALDAGDFLIYRNCAWHLGNYLPYQRRATLHDVVETPEYAAWRRQVMVEQTQRRQQTAAASPT